MSTKALRYAFPFLVFLSLISCAAKTMKEPYVAPNVAIEGVTKQQAMDMIIDSMASHGERIHKINDFQVTFAREADNFKAILFFGSTYDSTPEMRLTFTLTESRGGLHIFCSATMVTNPESAYEKSTDITRGNAKDLQLLLDEVKGALLREYGDATAGTSPGE